MIRSLSTATSGLQANSTKLDVTANNIANVGTAGYKASQARFTSALNQMLRGAGAGDANAGIGGTNPASIGLGVRVSDIVRNQSQGAVNRTNRPTDFALQGDGFFVVAQAGQQLYTRNGSFSLDDAGQLTTSTGGLVQGWQADAAGTVNPNGPLVPLRIPVGAQINPRATTEVNVGGNISADAPVGTAVPVAVTVYNTQGTQVPLLLTFTKTGTDAWSVQPSSGGTNLGAPTAVTFDPVTGLPSVGDLNITAATLNTIPGTAGTWDGAGITADFGSADVDGLRQFAGNSSAAALTQDGYAAGALQSFSVGQDGTITGSYTNGRTQRLGQLAVANFANAEGLEDAGNSSFRASINSGLAQIGVPGAGGRGLITANALEMSNADLTNEFPELIQAQRGFQANARVMTTGDEVLSELVNLKR